MKTWTSAFVTYTPEALILMKWLSRQKYAMAGINSTIKGFNVYLEAKEGKGKKKSIHKIFYSYISSCVRNLFFLLKKKKHLFANLWDKKWLKK